MPSTEELSSPNLSHAPVQPAAVRAAVEAATARTVFWPGNGHEALWDAPNGMTSDELVGRLHAQTGHLAMSPGRCSLRNSADLRSTAHDAYSLTSLEQQEELDAMMGGARYTWEPRDAAEPPAVESQAEAPRQPPAPGIMDIASAADAIVAAQAAVSRALIRPKSSEPPSPGGPEGFIPLPSDSDASQLHAAPLPQSFVFTSGPSAFAAPLPPSPHRFGAYLPGEESPVLDQYLGGELPSYTSFMEVRAG